MKLLLYYFIQWTWGLPQNLIGLALRLFCRGKNEPKFHGAAVRRWGISGSASLGMFLFLDRNASQKTLVHEYGHSVQSLILGPLFLPVIGLPSLLWAGFGERYRRRRGRSYYWFYPERWANRLGAYATGENPEEEVILCSKTETKP